MDHLVGSTLSPWYSWFVTVLTLALLLHSWRAETITIKGTTFFLSLYRSDPNKWIRPRSGQVCHLIYCRYTDHSRTKGEGPYGRRLESGCHLDMDTAVPPADIH